MNRKEFLQSPVPCQYCDKTEQCKKKIIACLSFAYFVETGVTNIKIPMIPDRLIYAKVMFHDDQNMVREINKLMRNLNTEDAKYAQDSI